MNDLRLPARRTTFLGDAADSYPQGEDCFAVRAYGCYPVDFDGE